MSGRSPAARIMQLVGARRHMRPREHSTMPAGGACVSRGARAQDLARTDELY